MCNCDLSAFHTVRYLPDGTFITYCQKCGQEVRKTPEPSLWQQVAKLIRADMANLWAAVLSSFSLAMEIPGHLLSLLHKKKRGKKRLIS